MFTMLYDKRGESGSNKTVNLWVNIIQSVHIQQYNTHSYITGEDFISLQLVFNPFVLFCMTIKYV